MRYFMGIACNCIPLGIKVGKGLSYKGTHIHHLPPSDNISTSSHRYTCFGKGIYKWVWSTPLFILPHHFLFRSFYDKTMNICIFVCYCVATIVKPLRTASAPLGQHQLQHLPETWETILQEERKLLLSVQ